MAKQEHLNLLAGGKQIWNQWRGEHPEIKPDLSDASLLRAELSKFDLSQTNLIRADLTWANLFKTNFRGANLFEADLQGTNLYKADFTDANLNRATLTYATLAETTLKNANLTDSYIYGISVWDVDTENANQDNLVVTRPGEKPVITVDHLEVGQFIYLILNNKKVRDVLDTITSKVVLILGRFTPERKAVLDALRQELRERDYLAVLFDFDKQVNRDTIETMSTLAHLALFVIADLTDAKSVLQELQRIVPHLPSVPVQPLLLDSQYEPGMLDSFRNYRSFLPVHRYHSLADLLVSLDHGILTRAEEHAESLRN